MKCPGCGTEIMESSRHEWPWEVTERVPAGRGMWNGAGEQHTPDRCRTASGYATLVEAARGVEAGWFGGEDYATVGHRMDALRTTLGALR